MMECDYSCETWGVNRTYNVAKRLDKLFITDTRHNLSGDVNHNFDEINAQNIPVISLHKFKEINKLRVYPYDKIVERFGSEFFTNTICYMIAYALYKGYKKIRLYGIDLATQLEYILERGGVEFWVGVATGMGVKVENTNRSRVCKPPMGVPYGHRGAVDMKNIDPLNLTEWMKKENA